MTQNKRARSDLRYSCYEPLHSPLQSFDCNRPLQSP